MTSCKPPPSHPPTEYCTEVLTPKPVLNTTATLTHKTPLPPGTTRPQALALLSDHLFFLACDPHMAQHELVPPSAFATLTPPPSIPDDVQAQIRSSSSSSSSSSKTKSAWKGVEEEKEEEVLPTCYRVTDIVHAIPAGIWDTRVVSVYEFTLIREGVFVRIRSPMGVVMETFWRVGEGEGTEDGRLVLVEDVTIRCSRLLVGIVRGQCEGNWRGIHGKVVERLEGELRGGLEGELK